MSLEATEALLDAPSLGTFAFGPRPPGTIAPQTGWQVLAACGVLSFYAVDFREILLAI